MGNSSEIKKNHILRRSSPRRLFAGIVILLIAVLVGLAIIEFKTSYLEARFLSKFAQKVSFSVQPGPNSSLSFPEHGPYDERLGYTRLPEFIKNLVAQGYRIEAQARPSASFNDMIEWGLYPSFREKNQAGLTILANDGRDLFRARYPERVYICFESAPSLIVNTLLFIENRELLDSGNPDRNPAIEWDRFAKALLDRTAHVLNSDHRFAGGSTLATQLEKFRHSPDGRTTGASEKLKQMVSASLRVYHNGKNTTMARRQLVLDYLNSVPLAALPGHGELNGLGDGLWAAYGADFDTVNRLLCDGCRSNDVQKALAYKQVLSLFIAQRRPAFYLVNNRGALESAANNHLHMLCDAGVITPALRDSALPLKLNFRQEPPEPPAVSFVGRKAANTIRRQLSSVLGVPRLYDLDRLDLSVKSTLNGKIQDEVNKILLNLSDPDYVHEAGLGGARLLGNCDPGNVIYSFTLYERAGNANLLRIQTDNFNQPFDLNEGMKIELGSTAKLRTLVTYLEIIAGLHERYALLPQDQLRTINVESNDRLTQWVVDYLSAGNDRSLAAILEAAMERRYSASPGEVFFTGGGQHIFHNFEKSDNSRIFSVHDALKSSINLVFIRMMRDIVRYYMYNVPGSTARILKDIDDPARQAYLVRFADKEGRIFLQRFYNKYRELKPEEQFELLLQSVRPIPSRLAAIFRYVKPTAGLVEFSMFLKSRLPSSTLSVLELENLYATYGPERWDLQDRGYIARLHPLELWLVAYLRAHPTAERSEIVRASTNERQEVYRWLFKTHRKNAQDIRIRSLLEVEAFLEIHKAWKRLGYPFDSLVPSYATAIGSSADRPASLTELVGIIMNDGIKYPVARINELRFASGTPYETLLRRKELEGQRILPPEICTVVRRALIDVADKGTAQQIRGAFIKSDGTPIPVGGKTGTGDNRRDVYGQRGQLLESHVINRAAVFVFFIGDRFFGTITAYVPGQLAAGYNFTSSLPVRILKIIAPALKPMIEKAEGMEPPASKIQQNATLGDLNGVFLNGSR
ncbi:MAG: transglycosylase domain-containing protein [Smithella sp.]